MAKRVIIFALTGIFIAVALAACAQIIGIEDLPPLPDSGLSAVTPDAAPLDEDVPALATLGISGVAPVIPLMSGVTDYTVDLPLLQESVTVTAAVNDLATGLTIAGNPTVSGMPSDPINLALGDNLVEIIVQGSMQRVYSVNLRRANQLAQYAYGKASNTGVNDRFGFRVALSGDTLAAGNDYEDSDANGINGNQLDNGAADSGAVYVFRRNGTRWAQEAYIKASNSDARDYFGFSVALSGNTLAVGAYYEDSAATGVNGSQSSEAAMNSGAVYIFERTGSTWSQQAYVKAPNTGAGDHFGVSVALSGDVLAVGANLEDLQATDGGAVYIYRRVGTNWQHEATVRASNADFDDRFGSRVALSDDTLAVGASQEDSASTGINGPQSSNAAMDSGAVYLFRYAGTTWEQEAYIKASNTDAYDQFSNELVLSGDTLVVGADGEDSSDGTQDDNAAAGSGAVYVFRRTGTDWQQEAYLKASNIGAGDGFGTYVALSGDTLAVGALAEDSGATDVDGDQTDEGATDSGAVYVFDRTGTTWQQTAYLKASNTGAGDNFGIVALSDDTLAVGARHEDSTATGVNNSQGDNAAMDSGAVYIFH